MPRNLPLCYFRRALRSRGFDAGSVHAFGRLPLNNNVRPFLGTDGRLHVVYNWC